MLAYSFAKGDTTFSVSAERRKPQVTVDQLLRMEIDSGVVKFKASFYYDVQVQRRQVAADRYSRNVGQRHSQHDKTMRREQLSPQPDDVAEGYTAWSFAAETELLGNQQVDLVWEQKIDELGIGKSQDITVPRLIPRDVDLATGQIVISKSESIDVQPTAGWEGLIPIDPHNDLRHGVRIENAAMAFTFVDTGRCRSVPRATSWKPAS